MLCTRTVLSRSITDPDPTGLNVLSSSGMLLGQSVLFWLLEPCSAGDQAL